MVAQSKAPLSCLWTDSYRDVLVFGHLLYPGWTACVKMISTGQLVGGITSYMAVLNRAILFVYR